MRSRGVLSVIVNLPEMHIPPWYWFSYEGETDSLVDVLAAHENAFVEWRYLEPKAGDLGANVNLLSSVLQALWAEYQLHP